MDKTGATRDMNVLLNNIREKARGSCHHRAQADRPNSSPACVTPNSAPVGAAGTVLGCILDCLLASWRGRRAKRAAAIAAAATATRAANAAHARGVRAPQRWPLLTSCWAIIMRSERTGDIGDNMGCDPYEITDRNGRQGASWHRRSASTALLAAGERVTWLGFLAETRALTLSWHQGMAAAAELIVSSASFARSS